MIFSNEIWRWICEPSPYSGVLKTQTRRLKKDRQHLVHPFELGQPLQVCTFGRHGIDPKPRTLHYVGQVVSVTPGRTKPAILYNPKHPCYDIDYIEPGDDHYNLAKTGQWNPAGQGYKKLQIRILDIIEQDARQMTHEQALADGFASVPHYLSTWCKMNDPKVSIDETSTPKLWNIHYPGYSGILALDYEVVEALMARQAEKYQCFAYTFERV